MKKENMENLNLQGECIMELKSKQDWIDNVPDKLPPKLSRHEKRLWIDSNGNTLECGMDFRAAEVMETYPVKIYRLKTCSQKLQEDEGKEED